MSTVLVVDAACDLPKSFLDERGIWLLPTSIRVDKTIYTDDKDPTKLLNFYNKGLLTREHDAESLAYTSEQITELFLAKIVNKFDFALVQTVSRKRSLIYDNALQSSFSILREYRGVRASSNAARQGSFAMRVFNTGTLFCGQGILAAYTSDLIAQGKPKNEILKLSTDMREKIHAFIVPPSVHYVRDRARKKGEDSISAFSAFIAKSLDIVPIIQGRNDKTEPAAKVRGFENAVDKLFNHAIKYINAGLLSPYVIVSVAGDLSVLDQFSAYKELLKVAQQKNIRVLPCVMGLTSGLNVGPGSIGLGFLAEDGSFSLSD
ncbi:MAG: DegV family protein [Cellvibrio sp.]|uniref:DegV family protein n=1 Tax=Cellvibrio sp. TaxID=1965322 RepID=UPI0031AC92CA